MAHITSLQPCEPPVWSRSGHGQTIWGFLLPSPTMDSAGEKFIVPLPDGDRVVGRVFAGTSPFVVVLFHGLTGTIESTYMVRSALQARKQGHTVVLMNHRGCGEGTGLARQPYHSGRGEDLSEVLHFLRARFPGKKQIAVGFSLSANALLLLLSGQRGEHLPDYAMAANGPIDLQACASHLKQGFNRIYDYRFVQDCKKEIDAKFRDGLIPYPYPISKWAHLQDVDDIYTAPSAGYKDALEYYRKCSAAPHLAKIKTPTFILTAKDDPFITWQPYLNAKDNPHVQLHIEDHGGHLGYLTRAPGSTWGYERWLDYAVAEVLRGFTK